MRRDEGMTWIGILVLLIMVAGLFFSIVKPMEEMYVITFYDKTREVTLKTDAQGIVRNTGPEDSHFKECAIIDVRKLQKGQVMTIFDLYGDLTLPKQFIVKEINHESGVF